MTTAKILRQIADTASVNASSAWQALSDAKMQKADFAAVQALKADFDAAYAMEMAAFEKLAAVA